MSTSSILFVMLGGAFGSVARYFFSVIFSNTSSVFPYATFIVNVIGSLIIGCIFALYQQQIISEKGRLFFAVGICGGFTTFSALSLEVLQLLQQAKVAVALGYIFLSLLLGIAAVFSGYKVGQLIGNH